MAELRCFQRRSFTSYFTTVTKRARAPCGEAHIAVPAMVTMLLDFKIFVNANVPEGVALTAASSTMDGI
jgi:hypothetical protein